MCSPAKSGLLTLCNERKHTVEELWNISLNKGKEWVLESRVKVQCGNTKKEMYMIGWISGLILWKWPRRLFSRKFGMLYLEAPLFEVLYLFFNCLWFLVSCFFSGYFIIISWTLWWNTWVSGCVLFYSAGV